MYLQRLKLSQFKNYEEVDVSFSPNVNCIVGNNGVGKTNLLDAIYYLSFCKSYFHSVDVQNIRRGGSYFAIHGTYAAASADERDGELQVSCVVKQGAAKQMKVNHKNCTSFSDHIGRLPLVVVSPNDQSLILGGSEGRRKFVDGVISQIDKQYLHSLLSYQKAVEQRNLLLKQFYENRYLDEESLSVWDEQLVRLGEPIHETRRKFMDELQPLFDHYFTLISNDADEAPQMRYQSQLNDTVPMAQQLLEARKRDALLQYSTVGVHKDDIEFLIAGYPAKKFGSQGQQKTFLLALKLAQFDYICSYCEGRRPILLLDDVFDKLDMLRVQQLLRLVGSEHFGQVFVTDTQQGRVESIFKDAPEVRHKIFGVADNQIFEKVSV